MAEAPALEDLADSDYFAPPSTPEPETASSYDDVDPDLVCPHCDHIPFKTKAAKSRHVTLEHRSERITEVSAPRRKTRRTLSGKEIRDDTGGRSAPTEEQLTTTFGKLLGYGAFVIAEHLVESDPRQPFPQEIQDQLILALAPSLKESREIMAPLARVAARTNVNRHYGRKIVDNVDAADSLIALYMWSRRLAKYMRERQEAQDIFTAQPAPQRVPTYDNPSTPHPKEGIVLTPDMVQQMQNGNGKSNG